MPRPSYNRVVLAPVIERREKLAINLFDLSHLPTTLRSIALAGKLDASKAIWVDKSRLDETAVEFICSLLDAATVCDLLRSESRRANDPPIRAYIKRTETWNRLPHTAILTVVESGRVQLSREWFPEKIELIEIAPLPIEKFSW